MKKLLSIVLSITIISAFIMAPSVSNASTTFSDVDASTEVGKAIIKLANAGIINGNGDGTFAPSRSVSRAELCKMVNNIKKYTEQDTAVFSDVTEDKWYYSHVKIAKKMGYIKGFEDGTFRGDTPVTREQACAIIVRVNGLYNLGSNVVISDPVSEWAENDVKTVISNRFISLETNNTFRATENMTRGELSLLLAHFVQEAVVTPGGSIGGGSIGGGSIGGGSIGGGSTGGGSTGGGSTGGGSTGGSTTPSTPSNPSTPDTPDTPEFDSQKQNLVVTKLTNLLNVLTDTSMIFDNDEQRNIINIVRGGPVNGVIVTGTIQKTLADAQNGEWIYVEGYVSRKYSSDVQMAKSRYKALDEEAQSAFYSKLALHPLMSLDDVEFLLEIMFGIDDPTTLIP